jgi:hypothetical protein
MGMSLRVTTAVDQGVIYNRIGLSARSFGPGFSSSLICVPTLARCP